MTLFPSQPVSVDLSENAKTILSRRYLEKNEQGETVEEPVDMFREWPGPSRRPSSSSPRGGGFP